MSASTRRRHVRSVSSLLVAALVAAACSGNGDGAETETPQDTQPVAVDAASTDGEAEQPDFSYVSYVDNLLEKEAAGEWTRGEGLAATLRLFAGEADPAEVLRSPEVVKLEGTGIVQMALAHLENDPDDDARAEIERFLGPLTLSDQQLEAMAGISGPSAMGGIGGSPAIGGVGGSATMNLSHASALTWARGLAQGVADCTPFWAPYEVPKGVGPCLEVQELSHLTSSYPGQWRLFRAADPLPDGGWTGHHFQLATTALEDAARVFDGLGSLPNGVNVVFSVVDDPANRAIAVGGPGKTCSIAIFGVMQADTDSDFKQVVAHELAHCFQFETYKEQPLHYELQMWREEGFAEYLSNVVYPANDLEVREGVPLLQAKELWLGLLDRNYDNFAWFQYLENELNLDGVLSVVRAIPSGSSRDSQEAILAGWPGMTDMWHDFAKRLTDDEIVDTSGTVIEYPAPVLPIVITGPASPRVVVDLDAFDVARVLLRVPAGQTASLVSTTHDEVEEVARRPAEPGNWDELPQVLPGPECQPESVLVGTSTTRGRHLSVDVPKVAKGDPDSLVGDWVADMDSLEGRVIRTFPQQEIDDYGGYIGADFRADGTVEIVYDGFTISGHSDIFGFGDAKLHTEITTTLDAAGTDGYEIKNEYIFYDSLFESDFLRGTETMRTLQRGTYFDAEGYVVEIREGGEGWETFETFKENLGWEFFGAAQEFHLGCEGSVLAFGSLDDVTALFTRSVSVDP